MQVLFTISMLLSFIGTILLIVQVIRNRKLLYGYSLLGALLVDGSIILLLVNFVCMKNYIAFVFGCPAALYWLFVCVFKLLYRK